MKLKKARKQAKGLEIRIKFKTKEAADRYVMRWKTFIDDGDVDEGITVYAYRTGKTAVLISNSKGAKRLLDEM